MLCRNESTQDILACDLCLFLRLKVQDVDVGALDIRFDQVHEFLLFLLNVSVFRCNFYGQFNLSLVDFSFYNVSDLVYFFTFFEHVEFR